MGFLKKKTDPIVDRSKALSAQIASLEAEIKRLDQQLQQGAVAQPRVRSTVAPLRNPAARGPRQAGETREPVFERVEPGTLDPPSAPEHFNDLGVRKYDLAGAWRRLRMHFRGPPASNPRLVTYLAAGSIKGLRPLRYEKRVARNRFIALFLILVALLWGIIYMFVRS